MDFGTVKERVSAYLGRVPGDLAFQMATDAMNQKLRLREMREKVSLPVSGGVATLPSDFLEPISLVNKHDIALTPTEQGATKHHYGGTPAEYVIDDSVIYLYPVPNDGDTITLVYYRTIATLTDATDTNLALLHANDAYVYAVLENHAILIRDFEAAQYWGPLAMRALNQTNSKSVAAMFSGGQIDVIPPFAQHNSGENIIEPVEEDGLIEDLPELP